MRLVVNVVSYENKIWGYVCSSENTVAEIPDNISNDECFSSHSESKQNSNLDIERLISLRK